MTDDKTPCGRDFEHDSHSVVGKKGVYICDGVIRSNKTHPTD